MATSIDKWLTVDFVTPKVRFSAQVLIKAFVGGVLEFSAPLDVLAVFRGWGLWRGREEYREGK